MWILLGTTITASFFDSLNPSAIAQQMLLQAMVKTKRHIWFFILGIGTANYLMGLAVYYGAALWISRLLEAVTEAWPVLVSGAACAAGAGSLILGVALTARTWRGGRTEGEQEVKTPARLSPLSLFALGAAFCLVELTSAFPYFGFLAMMAGYDPAAPLVLALIAVYDFMYVLPLILLYFGYNRLRGTAAIRALERVLGRVSAYLVPAVALVLGVALSYYGLTGLL